MKSLIVPLAIITVLVSCVPADNDTDNELITVSIEPFRYFVSAIAGDDYTINVIVPPGASPATYEPPPAVIKGINNSELIIINGYLGFEMAWIDRVTGMNEDADILRLSDNQDLIAADSHRHGDLIHYTGVDPHFWVSPLRAAIIARDIKDILVDKNPDGAQLYNENYLKLDSVIRAADSYVKSALDEKDEISFMIYHPSLTYLANDYGLNQIPVEHEGKEPSPSELKKLIDTGRNKNIKTIFVQKEFDRRNAELIGNEIGAETVVIDPLSNEWDKSVKFIVDNIQGKNNK